MLGYKRTHCNHHFNLVHIFKFSDFLSQLLIQSPAGEAAVFNLYYIFFSHFNPLRSHFCWVNEPTNQVSSEQQPAQLWRRMRQAKMGQRIRGFHAATETTLGPTGSHQRNSETPPEGGRRGLLIAWWESLCPFTWIGFLVIPATSQVATWESPTCSSRLYSNLAPSGAFWKEGQPELKNTDS